MLNKYALGEGLHPVWLNASGWDFAALMVLISLIRKPRRTVRISGRALRLSALSGAFLAAHFAAGCMR